MSLIRILAPTGFVIKPGGGLQICRERFILFGLENKGMNNEDKLRALQASGLFNNLSDEVLREIVPLLASLEFGAGEAIVQKGEPGDSMYLIVRGRVRAQDGERLLDELGPAEVFGEMAALDPEPRSATITALEPVQLVQLGTQAVYTLLSAHPEIGSALVRTLSRRLRARLGDMHEDYEYIQQVERLTAVAASVETGAYETAGLEVVARRTDPLGQLARVFRRMVQEVQAREERLKQEVRELRIEIDQTRQAQKVAEITESDYFRSLRSQADSLRQIIQGDDETPNHEAKHS